MKIIAHRGNLEGPNPIMENHPDYLKDAILRGFNVEIDLWREGGKWALGHDEPTYETTDSYLSYLSNGGNCWIHVKNLEALSYLASPRSIGADKLWNYFWHENDDYTLTSRGNIWSAKDSYHKSVVSVFLGEPRREHIPDLMGGICTDYAITWRSII